MGLWPLLFLWGPVLCWMAVIFLASSGSVPGPVSHVPDWVTHAAAYLILAVLFCRAIAGGFQGLPARGVLLAAALSTLYGVSDEYHQSFVAERHAELADVGKDLLGAAVGGWLYSKARPSGAVREEAGKE